MVVDRRTVVALVGMVKLALVVPAAMVMLAGTVAVPGSLFVSVTDAPPAGAAPVRVTVPVTGEPPTALLVLRVNEAGVGAGNKVIVAVLLLPAGKVPVMVTLVWAGTTTLEAMK